MARFGVQPVPVPLRICRHFVDEPAVIGGLLVGVVVVVVAGDFLAAVEPKGRRGILIVLQQAGSQPVYGRRVGGGSEDGLSFRIQRMGIRAEVVIEGDILVEDDDQMLNRRSRSADGSLGGGISWWPPG